jgi:hypothetical protein
MADVEAVMGSDPGSQAMGPNGRLALQVGDHVAAAERLIEQSTRAIERVRARMRQTDRQVQRTSHRVQDAAGMARVAERPVAGAGDRYLRAKQRELAAHERAIQRHDEAAALQERFGHPDRAASAREHGRQARELYERALHELHAWAGLTNGAAGPPWPRPGQGAANPPT